MPPVHRHLRLLLRRPCHLLPFSSGGHHPARLCATGITCLRANVGRRGVRAEGGYQQGRRHLSPPSPLQRLIVVSSLLLSLSSVVHHLVVITSSSLSEPPPPSSSNRRHQLPLCRHHFLPPFLILFVFDPFPMANSPTSLLSSLSLSLSSSLSSSSSLLLLS